MSIFLVVRWWVWLAMLLFGAVLAAMAAALLSGRKPTWSPRRRVFAAAALAPLLILAGSIGGAAFAFVSRRPGEWSDLVAGSLLQLGLWSALVTFLAGLGAAAAAERSLRE